MRYGIFSDVHANLEALEAVIDAYGRETIDRYLCLGDCVGYGADPRRCIEETARVASVIIAGNHDWAAAGLFPDDYFNPDAKQALTWTRQTLEESQIAFLGTLDLVYKEEEFTLVHGTLQSPERFDYMVDMQAASGTFSILETPLCFLGHSHVPGFFVREEKGVLRYLQVSHLDCKKGCSYIVNVGSVGQPRDGNPLACYCVYDSSAQTVDIKRIRYDFQTARKKIIACGLPEFLGERLLAGR